MRRCDGFMKKMGFLNKACCEIMNQKATKEEKERIFERWKEFSEKMKDWDFRGEYTKMEGGFSFVR